MPASAATMAAIIRNNGSPFLVSSATCCSEAAGPAAPSDVAFWFRTRSTISRPSPAPIGSIGTRLGRVEQAFDAALAETARVEDGLPPA